MPGTGGDHGYLRMLELYKRAQGRAWTLSLTQKCLLSTTCALGLLGWQLRSREMVTFMINCLMTKSFAALKCDPAH